MPSGQGTDLISQLHADKARKASEAIAATRRRRTRRTIALLITVVVLAALAVAAKLAVDQYRADELVQRAEGRLAGASVTELQSAEGELDEALDLVSAHPRALALRALVRAHASFIHGQDLEAAVAAVDEAKAADGDAFYLGISSSMVELSRGDVDEADRILSELSAPAEPTPVTGHHVWLSGVVALNHPLDAGRISDHLTKLSELSTSDASWAMYVRTHAELLAASGDAKAALEATLAARESHPTEFGLAVDELVLHALLHESTSSVETTATQLLAQPEELIPRDIARLSLARGIARVHDGEHDAAVDDLVTAWNDSAAWDNATRREVLVQLISGGADEEVNKLLGSDKASKGETEMYEAGALLASSDAGGALTKLAKLSQEHPEVAYLQAIALTEQRRFAEARPWIDRALEFFPHRVDLQVCDLRVQAHGDGGAEQGKKVAPKLQKLADDHSHAPGIWTSLGEAQLTAEDEKAARSAFKKALKRERRPAQAHLHLAELTPGNTQKDLELRKKVREHLDKAIEHDSHSVRYKEALAAHLLFLGDEEGAAELMKEVVENPLVDPATLLSLAAIRTRDAANGDDASLSKTEKLLTRAQERGAEPVALARERARAEIARKTPESAAKARGLVEPLIAQNPSDIELRLVYLDVLVAQNEASAAAENARAGIRRNPKENGRLFFAWARAELAKDNERAAARQTNDGWDKLIQEQVPAVELLEAAELAVKLWVKLKKDDVARRAGRRITSALPHDARAWAIRAEVEMETKREDNACESASTGLKLGPPTEGIHATMARCHSLSGRRAQAKAEYEKAAELAKGTPAAKRYLKRARALD